MSILKYRDPITGKWEKVGMPSSSDLITYVDEQIASIPTPDVSGQINNHNTDENAHSDIRALIDAKSDFSGSYNDLTDQPSIPSIAGLATVAYVDEQVGSVDVPTSLAELSADETHRTVTDAEKATWNAKSNFSGNYNDLTNKPSIPSIAGLATTAYVDQEIGKIDIPDALADLSTDANHRVVTDAEKATWNAKSNFSGNYNDLTNKPSIPSIAGLATESYVDSLVASAFHYKGTKTKYSDLPSSNNVVGDVWNITEASANNKAGDNVAWSGTGWDVLAGTVDLSAYYTIAQVNSTLSGYAKKATTLAGYGITDGSPKGHTHTVTHKPAGSVTSSFTGTAAEHNHGFSGTKATISTTYTPAGSVSSSFKGTEHGHSFTGSAVTSGKPDTTNVTTIYSITGVGSLPSASLDKGTLPSLTFNKGTYPTLTFSAGTLPSASHTAASLTSAIANRCMTVTFTADSHSFSAGSLPSASLSAGTLPSATFNAGSLPSLTFSAGSLPTRSSAISMPNTNHTHSVTAAGTVNGNTAGGTVSSGFTGTQATIAAEYTPAGTVANKSVTPAGTVSSSFSGTSATLTTSADS